MRKIKRSTGVALAFLIYVSVTAAYLLPRNTEVSQTEKILTVAGSYVIVFLLWLVLRKKEQMRERRKKDEQDVYKRQVHVQVSLNVTSNEVRSVNQISGTDRSITETQVRTSETT